MAKLEISPKLSLPSDAVTQTFGCIGRKGAGKTYLATLLAEKMLDIGAQVVVVDPVGNWWGLRVAADGKSKGKDIFIAGGERGDVPVLPESGARFAKLVVEKNVSLVLDISGFRQGERKRFAADFAEEFFHLKKAQRSAVHLFIEEAQLFAPQRTGPEEARMLGAFENIIRLGRNYGIGATMVSQRPQSINKEVLSQVECLCVLQVNGSHERKALEEWVQEAGADRKLIGELPGLSRGEGFVWSPSWLRIFQRMFFGQKTTFDASATPEVGRKTKTALLSAVDVELLKADLQEVISQASKNDPKALRKRIAELEKLEGVANNGLLAEREERIQKLEIHARELSAQLNAYRSKIETVRSYAKSLYDTLAKEDTMEVTAESVPHETPIIKSKRLDNIRHSQPRANTESNGNLRSGARRMLTCLVQWYPSGRTEAQVAAQVQMKRTGGTWAAYKSDLKNGGYFEVRDGLWFATKGGIDYVGADAPEMPSSTEDVVRLWGDKLRLGARNMLDVLVRHKGRNVTRESLGGAIGMEPSGGTFSAYLSDLKQAGLIVVDRDGVRANAETLLL